MQLVTSETRSRAPKYDERSQQSTKYHGRDDNERCSRSSHSNPLRRGGHARRATRRSSVVNLFAHEEPSRDRVSANLGRSRAVDTDVSFIMTRNERKKSERWIGTCRDGKGMKFPPFTMSAINGRTALHPLQVSRFVARRALWASARFNRIIIGRGWEPTL